jgi:hypothetical protein
MLFSFVPLVLAGMVAIASAAPATTKVNYTTNNTYTWSNNIDKCSLFRVPIPPAVQTIVQGRTIPINTISAVTRASDL